MRHMKCNLHHIFDIYEYIIVFYMIEKLILDLKIKHFSLYMAVGTSSFVVLRILYN